MVKGFASPAVSCRRRRLAAAQPPPPVRPEPLPEPPEPPPSHRSRRSSRRRPSCPSDRPIRRRPSRRSCAAVIVAGRGRPGRRPAGAVVVPACAAVVPGLGGRWHGRRGLRRCPELRRQHPGCVADRLARGVEHGHGHHARQGDGGDHEQDGGQARAHAPRVGRVGPWPGSAKVRSWQCRRPSRAGGKRTAMHVPGPGSTSAEPPQRPARSRTIARPSPVPPGGPRRPGRGRSARTPSPPRPGRCRGRRRGRARRRRRRRRSRPCSRRTRSRSRSGCRARSRRRRSRRRS